MNAKNKSFALPLTFIGIMFFAIGFALGINSLLVPVLQGSLGISNAASYLIIAATFIPFLVFGYPAGLTIKAIGYKRTMSLSFIIFAVAFYLFILSADYKSFSLFLLASFISGAANAYLQASVNPYITILGPLESAAKRISIMGICNKLAWPIPSIFIVWLLGKDVNLIGIEDLNKPFVIIICAFVALGIMAFFAPLPEVTPDSRLTKDVERCLQYSQGNPLLYFATYEELRVFLVGTLEWEDHPDGILADLKAEKDFVVYANTKGMLLAPGVAACFRDSHNPAYDAQTATAEGYELFCLPGRCPFDLLKYGMQNNLLCDVALPFDRGREILQQNWDFIARYFLGEYYEGD